MTHQPKMCDLWPDDFTNTHTPQMVTQAMLRGTCNFFGDFISPNIMLSIIDTATVSSLLSVHSFIETHLKHWRRTVSVMIKSRFFVLSHYHSIYLMVLYECVCIYIYNGILWEYRLDIPLYSLYYILSNMYSTIWDIVYDFDKSYYDTILVL